MEGDAFLAAPLVATLGDSCCGCGACAAACPATCIEMAPDVLGFLRPNVDAGRCLACGRCDAICPVLGADGREPDGIAGAWWVRSVDAAKLAASSSGGVFGLLAEKALVEGGAVYGAEVEVRAEFRDRWGVPGRSR